MVEVVTTRSWGQRIKSALTGFLIGPLLIIIAFYLIFWNEGNGLHTAQALSAVLNKVVDVPTTPINPRHDLAVVHLSGLATTTEQLQDQQLGVQMQAIQLIRSVEMYQWQEHKETKTDNNTGGSQKNTTTYTYDKTWSSSLVNSQDFQETQGHQNPQNMPITSSNWYAQKVNIGDFMLPEVLIKTISVTTPVTLSTSNMDELKTLLSEPVQRNNQGLYVGANPNMPAVGDLRISESVVLPQTVSVIGQQTSNTLQPYVAFGKSIILLVSDTQSAAQMIEDAQNQNSIQTWIVRAISFVMLFLGLILLVQPLVILADVLPFLGSIVGFGTGLVALAGAFILWSTATAIAWFTVRPLAATILLVIGITLGVMLVKMKKKKLQQPTA